MSAKSIYESIMKIILFKEDRLKQDQYLRVTLEEYPEYEVIQIGHLDDDYLFFTIAPEKGILTTLLRPPSSPPLRLDVLTMSEIEPSKKKNTVGFLGDVSKSD